MTDDIEIKAKTGLEMKQEISDIIWKYTIRLRETKTVCPFSEYIKNAKIEVLCKMHSKILDISPTKNGG
jgi:hypothetical protein